MKPFDLEQRLREARVPERKAEYWAEFHESVKRRLGTERVPATPTRARWLPLLGSAAAAACGVILGFVLWHRAPPPPDPYDKLKSGQALREILPFYVGRLQAIVQDGDRLQLMLSKEKNVSTSLPVWVEIDDGGHRHALVTFSGQSFRWGGEEVEVLANPDGQVMLVGDGFLWTNRGAASATGGVRVEARLLPQSF